MQVTYACDFYNDFESDFKYFQQVYEILTFCH